MLRVCQGVDESAWRRLAVPSPLQSCAWLSVMASRLPGQVYTVTAGDRIGFIGVLVRDEDAYEAYNPHAILWRDPPVFPLADPGRRRARLRGARGSGLLPALALVAPGYFGDPAGRDRHDPAVIREALAALVRWCAGNDIASLHILYTQDETAAVASAVADLGGVSFPLTYRWRLPVWWDGWDSYLAGFTRKRARRIRYEVRAAAAAGIVPGRVDLDHGFERVLAGRCALLRHYRQPVDEAAERARLVALANAFGPSLRVYGALRGDDPVASIVCIQHGRMVNVVYAGTTDQARDHYPYAHFLAVYYAIAGDVTKQDIDEIDYGIGHARSKSLRGCRPQALYGHGLAVRPELAGAVRLAGGLLAESASGEGNEG